MVFPRKIILFAAILFLLIFSSNSYSQIVFKSLPEYKMPATDSLFLGISSTRKIISLNGTWAVRPSNEKSEKAVAVNIPSIFKGNGELTFEKQFALTNDQIIHNRMTLNILGLNYTADISVNNIIIYRHSGGAYPFHIDLPRDVLHSDRKNVLTIKLFYKLDSENTIPLKQRFLFPQNFGGIFRDAYISLIPNISIVETKLESKLDGHKKAEISVYSKIDNKEFSKLQDSTSASDEFSFKVNFISPDSEIHSGKEIKFSLPRNKEKSFNQTIEINSPALWSPANPQYYVVNFELWRNDQLIDVKRKRFEIYSLEVHKDSVTLNGEGFQFNGVTYIPSFGEFGSLADYNKMEKDIETIKNIGFNSIRFEKEVPHPYYLYLCEKYGLLAFIELPLNGVPDELTLDQNFITRSENYLSNFIKGYQEYPAVAAIGVGGSYLPQLDSHVSFIKRLCAIIKKESNFLSFASFSGFDIPKISDLDLYGVEIFDKSVNKYSDEIQKTQTALGKGRVLIGSATYVVNAGNSNGYVNDYSFEAQAKFFEDLLNYSDQNSLPGYFINSAFDYRGDYSSLIAGYNKENLYKIGLIGEDRRADRLSYNVVYSKLHNTEKVTIPIGSKKNDAPMSFILFGLILALIIGVLVNSGKKFREDSSRALLRPYNFFADVRDQRIISGYHSTMLGIVVSAVSGLLLINILFYLRLNVVFEKLLLAFGSPGLIDTVSYLAWHPLLSIFWLSIGFLVFIFLLTLIIKASSFFVRNRVYLSSVYFTVVWSFLPVILLIPVGIILYRVLNADVANTYIYIGLIFFAIWVFYRLIKGIYVIFDVNPSGVYFYGIILIVVVLSVIFFYYEVNSSLSDYLKFVFQQYKIFS